MSKAAEYIKAYTRGCSNELVGGGYQRWLTVEDALAAVELAREKLKEPASEDLEKYKELVADELPQGSKLSQNGEFTIDVLKPLIKDAVKLGAQWQKEQMMKDAIEGYVSATICLAKHCPEDIAEIQVRDSRIAAKVGEKVKVIIIKE